MIMKWESERRMHLRYEIYIDSLFLLNFAMNLYLLLLLNKSLNYTATYLRLFMGACMGGAGYCLLFFLPSPGPYFHPIWKILLTAIAVPTLEILYVFSVRSLRLYFALMEKMMLFSFCYGGFFYVVLNRIPSLSRYLLSMSGVLSLGGLLTMYLHGKIKKKDAITPQIVTVVLQNKEKKITVNALVDTGNCLKEPISNKPVCILEKSCFDSIGIENPESIRVVPFRSVGCRHGMLLAYLMEELHIRTLAGKIVCRDVYVSVCEEILSSQKDYRMLLHPKLLDGKTRDRSQNGRSDNNTIYNISQQKELVLETKE